MPATKPSTPSFIFQGVRVNSNPLGDSARVDTSATSMNGLRFLRGLWMRLVGGRKARWFNAVVASYFRQIHEFKDLTYTGFNLHMFQFVDTVGVVVKWQWKNIVNWITSDVCTIKLTNDNFFALNNKIAVVNIRDKVILYNGLGERSGGESRPPFTNWTPSIGYPYYFGLDAYCPGGSAPVAGTTAGGGSGVDIVTSRRLGVGLFNVLTGHFSNVVDCVAVLTPDTDVNLQITSCHNLAISYNNASEQNALYLVPYVSIDGGEVLHPLIDPTTNDYLRYGYGITATITLNAAALANIDLAHEAPRFNHPPRPMRWLAYVQGIAYGGLMVGGAGGDGGWHDGFGYTPNSRDQVSVAYSAVDSDDEEIMGIPEECWPPDHKTPTPNSEAPVWGVAVPKDYRLLVLCPTTCFVVARSTDGVHEWTEVSGQHGVNCVDTVVVTDHGIVWMDQRNQKCRLVPNADGGSVEILSVEYDTVLGQKTPRTGYYVIDPETGMDRYEVAYTDGTISVHDFAAEGEGYTYEGDVRCGKSVTDYTNNRYHLVANRHIYSHAGQPEDGRELYPNEDYTAAGIVTKAAIVGTWESQWLSFGDEEAQKEVFGVRVVGDVDNISVRVVRDFDDETIPENTDDMEPVEVDSEKVRYAKRFRIPDGKRVKANMWKFLFTLVGPVEGSHPPIKDYGGTGQQTNFRGTILRVAYKTSKRVDR